MQKDLYLTNTDTPEDCKMEMYVESFDVATFYQAENQGIKMAVRLRNACGEPVPGSKVDLYVASPEGNRYSLTAYSDRDGIAYFEIADVMSGLWEIAVYHVSHPHYPVDLSALTNRRVTVYV